MLLNVKWILFYHPGDNRIMDLLNTWHNTINNGSAVIIGRISKCPFSILHSGGNGDNLTQHLCGHTLQTGWMLWSSSRSCCDLVINLGHDDDNYYHIFNLHSSSPGDNNTLFVSSQVISQHQDKSVSVAPWLLFQGALFMELDPAVLWSLLHSQLLLSFHLHCHFIDFLLLKYLQNM